MDTVFNTYYTGGTVDGRPFRGPSRSGNYKVGGRPATPEELKAIKAAFRKAMDEARDSYARNR